jgi:hypothetical protein
MLRVTTALAFLLFGVSNGQAQTTSLEQCRTLFASPAFDCGCVAGFMQERFDPVESEIVLKFWAVTVDKGRYRDGILAELYRRHGSPTITEALFRFNLVRVQLFTNCPASQPDRDYGF